MSKLENNASERAVLAGLCQFGLDAYLEMDFIDVDHFTDSMNQILFSCISKIINQNAKVDLTSILSAANELGVYDKIHNKNEIGFIRSLFNFPIHKENVAIHAAKITKLKLARDLGKTLSACAEDIQNVSGDEDLMDIVSKVEEPILDATGTLYQSSNKTTETLGDGLEEYMEFLLENPTDYVGIPSGFPHFDLSIGGGLRRKSVDLIAARPKALRHGSLVYTPYGPVKIEDVKVGDVVLHPIHKATTVTAVWPHSNIDIYRIHFKDGDTVDCCEDHIWHVEKSYGDSREELKTTKELINDLTFGSQGRYKWFVPLPKIVEFRERHVSIDPYAMGVLLGDGSVANNTCVYHTMDNEIHEYMTAYASSLGLEVKIDQQREGNKAISYRINGLQDKLRESGIFGHNCYNKFVPKEYIYNTTEVRLGVLAGLLDTDGDCTIDNRSNNSRVRFGSVSLQLCKDVKEIVQSLGGLCSIRKTQTKCDGKVFDSYRCEVRLPEGINPFRLSRKAEKFTGRQIGQLKRTIVKIEKVGQDDARCLTLSDNDGLFMTDNYVVTHNTGKSMFGDAVALHVSREHNIPVLMLDTEMSKEDHYNRIVASISGVEINKISSGKFGENPTDKEKVLKAIEELKTIPYHYISIAGQSFENILAVMRKWIYQHVGFDENGRTKDCLIVYDYLKLMGSEGISASMQEYQVLGFQITKLHNFCVKYDVPCLSFVQLNRDGITKESTDVVSGSDRLIWLCTSFTIFKMKSEEEIAEDTAQYGNRKLVPVVARHGSGLDDGDYINIKMHGSIGKIEESRTRNQIHAGGGPGTEGFEIDDIDPDADLSDL